MSWPIGVGVVLTEADVAEMLEDNGEPAAVVVTVDVRTTVVTLAVA